MTVRERAQASLDAIEACQLAQIKRYVKRVKTDRLWDVLEGIEAINRKYNSQIRVLLREIDNQRAGQCNHH